LLGRTAPGRSPIFLCLASQIWQRQQNILQVGLCNITIQTHMRYPGQCGSYFNGYIGDQCDLSLSLSSSSPPLAFPFPSTSSIPLPFFLFLAHIKHVNEIAIRQKGKKRKQKKEGRGGIAVAEKPLRCKYLLTHPFKSGLLGSDRIRKTSRER
jgi:hypothetical protein